MKILLVDVDSKIPNLALMKLSRYHNMLGDSVSFTEPEPDIIYASAIFKKNRHKLDGLPFLYPDAKIIIGGSGFNLKVKLPDEIERLCPDYSLYPEMDYSLGFTTRGCIRDCHFCIVREKEGRFQRWQHPQQFHDDRFDKIQLLDNNWFADQDWFFETSNWIIDKKLALIENGMDIRLLNHEIAHQLKRIKWAKSLHFAFDDERDHRAVMDGIRILNESNISVRNQVYFYIYCHDDAGFDSALRRCQTLKENHTNAFLMFNQDSERTPRIMELQRWANRPQLFWSISFEDYKKKGGKQ